MEASKWIRRRALGRARLGDLGALSLATVLVATGLGLLSGASVADAREAPDLTQSSSCIPTISSVGNFQLGSKQHVVIMGSCFGTTSPSSGADSKDLRIDDSRYWHTCSSHATRFG